MPKDNRIYITEKGIARYLDAVAKQQDIEITHMIIDSVLLPDNADPKKVEKIAKPAHTPFPAHVKRVGNTLMMMSDAPVGVGDFHIWGVAFALADGTVFAYARGLGDYKTKTDPLRIKFEVSSLNGDSITNNYDASALFVTYEDLNEHQSAVDEKMMSDAVAFCRSESQQAQQAKQHMALSKQVDDLKPADAADIDAKASGLIKYVNLSMLWRALAANLREAKLHTTLNCKRVMTAAKNHTNAKYSAAIHHMNTEKGKTITELKSFISSNYLSKSSSGATKSFGHNGYIKLPSFLGGLIIQYGTAHSAKHGNSGLRTPLPITYPNAHLMSVGTHDHFNGHLRGSLMVVGRDKGGVSFLHHNTQSLNTVAFISIGY